MFRFERTLEATPRGAAARACTSTFARLKGHPRMALSCRVYVHNGPPKIQRGARHPVSVCRARRSVILTLALERRSPRAVPSVPRLGYGADARTFRLEFARCIVRQVAPVVQIGRAFVVTEIFAVLVLVVPSPFL